MIVENSQQDIHFDNEKTKIGIKISGGADSAIVLYMLSKYIVECGTGAKIIPITVNHEGKDYQEQYAKQVIDYCKNIFGNIFGQHYIARNSASATYVSTQTNLVNTLYEKDIIECPCVGITRDPPKDISETFGHPGPSDDRSPGKQRPVVVQDKIFRPLINIDKRGVAELYNTLEVTDTLFPLTRSCEAVTSDFTKHCKTGCWFCQERYWGFGRYE